MKDIRRKIDITTLENLEDTNIPIDQEGLNQVVEIIEIYNISDEELQNFFDYKDRINIVVERLDDDLVEEFIQDRLQYEQDLIDQFGEEILSLSALAHLLPGKAIDIDIAKNIKSLDVPDGLIQSFLDERLERLEKEAGIIN